MKSIRSIWKLSIIGLLALSLLPAAFAQGKGHGNGKGKGQAKHDRDDDRDRDNDSDRDHDRDRGDDVRGSLLGRSTDSSRPPGWDKGRKTGWGNCDVPPGQVKKYGCHPNDSLL